MEYTAPLAFLHTYQEAHRHTGEQVVLVLHAHVGEERVRASGPADLPRELQLFPINTGHHGDRPICTPGCSLHGDGSHTPPVGGVATPCMKSPQVMLTIKPGTGRAYE